MSLLPFVNFKSLKHALPYNQVRLGLSEISRSKSLLIKDDDDVGECRRMDKCEIKGSLQTNDGKKLKTLMTCWE
jgi:hypothetical protein